MLKRKTSALSKAELYSRVYAIIGTKTPIQKDCGQLCDAVCCKGTQDDGMLLFPGERSLLTVKKTENGNRLAVCNGTCDRAQRPLACRIFPFFPILQPSGAIRIEIDARALRMCPLAAHAQHVKFERGFLCALSKAAKLLAADADCAKFMRESAKEIRAIRSFFSIG